MRRWLVLAVALPLLGTGCGPDPIDPVIPVQGRHVAVIPFQDPLNPAFESMEGIATAEMVSEILRREADPELKVLSTDQLESRLHNMVPSELTPSQIARALGVDLLLIGAYTSFETQLPGDIGIRRGRAQAEVKLLSAEGRGVRQVHRTTIKVRYPTPRKFSSPGFSTLETDEDEIRLGLIAAVARQSAMLLYSHEPEEE